MSNVPAHPRIAHLLLCGQALGLSEQAYNIAALLGERDILRGGSTDLHSRLAILSGELRAQREEQVAAQRTRQSARQ